MSDIQALSQATQDFINERDWTPPMVNIVRWFVTIESRYSHHIMKQDFRRCRDGWDAPSWREEKP